MLARSSVSGGARKVAGVVAGHPEVERFRLEYGAIGAWGGPAGPACRDAYITPPLGLLWLGAAMREPIRGTSSRLQMSNKSVRRCRLWFAAPPPAMTLVAVELVLLMGCGPRTDRLAITGKVTLDGVPLDRGSIRFTSLGDQPLLVSGALIQDGRYNIPEEKGLRPGTYRVQINSPDLKAPPVMAPATPSGPGFSVPPERIPPEYNVDSKQTVEVTADGDNSFAFDIVRRSAR